MELVQVLVRVLVLVVGLLYVELAAALPFVLLLWLWMVRLAAVHLWFVVSALLWWVFAWGLIALWCCLRLGFGHWSWVPHGEGLLLLAVEVGVVLLTGWGGR